jgi:hypothetical protein
MGRISFPIFIGNKNIIQKMTMISEFSIDKTLNKMVYLKLTNNCNITCYVICYEKRLIIWNG